MYKYFKYLTCLLTEVILVCNFLMAQTSEIDAHVIQEFNVGSEIGQFRAYMVNLHNNQKGIFIVYSEEGHVDPWSEMFFFPKYPLKFAMYDINGNEIWRKIHHPGVIPGEWFCPVHPCDLNNDGIDEIYYVTNIDSVHPLAYSKYRLASLDPLTGETTGLWPWKKVEDNARMGNTYRNYIFSGYVRDKKVLLTAQGTYGNMSIQAWNEGMHKRWEINILKTDSGSRASHSTPVFDINFDGVDEFMWGERCIEMDKGEYLFIADKNIWNGHSDIVQPVYNKNDNRWYIYTCRETGYNEYDPPRVVLFDDEGKRVWNDLEYGHMDMGWVANLKGYNEPIAMSIRIGMKSKGPEGTTHTNVEEFAWKVFSGEQVQLPFSTYGTLLLDIDGDGFHEIFTKGRVVIDEKGKILWSVGEGGNISLKEMNLGMPGKQILCYYPDGTIKIWGIRKSKN